MIASLLHSRHPIRRLLTRSQIFPLLGYVALIIGFVVIAWLGIASLVGDYADYHSAADLLDRLEGRKPFADASALSSGMYGSPFLEGPTVEIAGAALEQRVVSAVKNSGGNVLSSQIDLQGSETKQGYVSLSAACEVDESALQQLLYDLESGMPFVFIDQLVVQMPQLERTRGLGTENSRMRVQIDVSGQWQVTK
jgi:general secretion pathway protein M